ncbi:hypothetical protein PHYPO_G00030290 [Pangasianodon hypophthalmus]|uniref:SET domain-containing protein n=1 Tax=Pangasianodon hypophthalmus TaxID=310915 RepID=A0A5N5MJW5_PANHP|nr:hypothetical protein PHYPO_G00030290 [Pangasianodon hypophthalmus]
MFCCGDSLRYAECFISSCKACSSQKIGINIISFPFKSFIMESVEAGPCSFTTSAHTTAPACSQLTSDGTPVSSLVHVTPQNGELQKNPIKKEEPEDEGFIYGGASNFVGHITTVDQQNEGFQKKPVKKEEPENDDYLYCEHCKFFFINKCEVHGPALFIPDTPVPMGITDRARQTLPPGLEVRKSGIPDAGLGVFNMGETLPVGAHFGPYQGELVDQEEAMDSGYSWVIFKSGRTEQYIDARKEIYANWMRFVNCARSDTEQNLVAFQYQGGILYRCCRSVKAGDELLVWYEEEYAKYLGILFDYLWDKKCPTNGYVYIL